MSSTQRVRYLIEAVNTTAGPFKDAEEDLKRLNKSRLEANTLVFAERRAQQYLMATYRMKYSAIYDTLGLMRSVGTIGNQIISMVNAENIAQIRLRDTLLDVEEAQLRLNTALGLFGEDSVQYQSAFADLEDATRRFEDAQNAATMALVGVGLQAVGTMAQIGYLILKLGELNAIGILGFPSLISAIAAIGAAAAAALAVVGGLIGIELMGGPKTPTPMSGLLPPELGLTREELEAGKTYEDKYGEWREGELMEYLTGEGYFDERGSGGTPRAIASTPSSGSNTNYIDVNVRTDADPDAIADAVVRAIKDNDRVVR